MPWAEWIRTVEIEPSLYAADFAHLGDQVETLLRTGARIFHYDIGDGHFVEPITMGPIVLASISEFVHRLGGVVDCHLMTETPEKHFQALAEAGGDSVTVHVEAVEDLAAVVRTAREHQLQVGLAVKPASNVDDAARAALDANVDLVLCMSVEPGYSGQAFLPGSLERLRRLRELLPPQMYVQVDGGIGPDNVRAAHEAGADLLVAASSIFSHADPPRAYRRLVQELG
jgi:ribulose-phosphate 3-epimerase